MTLPEATLRIIDANLDRAGEGLRLIEDIARFILDDAVLTHELKAMRHQLVEGDWPFQQQLLQSRNSISDVGADIKAPVDKERELPLVVVANARRVQESLRVLEELAKLPGNISQLDGAKFKQARFSLYTIEQRLLAGLLGQEKLKHLPGLYVIIDTPALKGRPHVEVANQAINGGATTIQLRDKLLSRRELLPIAQELQDLCTARGVLFIVNDYLDVALAVDADGLHVGQDDLPAKIARQLLPMGKILGVSVITVEQAIAAQADGADYIAVGPVYPTPSKETDIIVGLERLRQVRQEITVPLVAIGGITHRNAADVIAAGALSLAVISAVAGAELPEAAARQMLDVLKQLK